MREESVQERSAVGNAGEEQNKDYLSRNDEERMAIMRVVVRSVVDAIRWWRVNISETVVSKAGP